MSERLSFPGHGKKPEFDVKVLEISDLPKGPENLLFGLTRITNLKVGSMDLPQVSLQGFNDQLQAISTSLGRKPHALVLCNAGILRSKILAEYLFREQTVELESPNMNKRKNRARGLGVNSGLRDFVFDFSPEGLAIVEEGKEERNR